MRYAVILAGGSGTRLWPASRRNRPKQLLPLGARPGESLLAATARRVRGTCEQVLVVTTADQAAAVRRELPDLAADGVVAEPAGRNTAAALGLAALHLAHRDPEAVLAALPADHHIEREAAFAGVVSRALDIAAARDVIVTVGIVPTRPETGFGYLRLAEGQPDGSFSVAAFVEKPDAATARRYLASGDYLWNGGLFVAKARHLLAEIQALMPQVHEVLGEIGAALARGGPRAAQETAAKVYPGLPSVSFDYGVMEKTRGVVAVRGDVGWNDVGSWSALADYRRADAAGNVTQGQVILCDAHNNIILADDGRVIALVGVSDLVVVQSGDGILVVPRQRAQDVRRVVDALEHNGLDKFL